jgi:hypothetical protein
VSRSILSVHDRSSLHNEIFTSVAVSKLNVAETQAINLTVSSA